MTTVLRLASIFVVLVVAVRPITAQRATNNSAVIDSGVVLPASYVIGPDDALRVAFWNEPTMSGDAIVRPDGKISLPLLNDVQAAGLTPEEFGASLVKASARYFTDPKVTVMVTEVRSRKVYVLGEVARPGPLALNDEMNVLQAISAAGGLLEWAKKTRIEIVRTDKERGTETRHKFNYKDAVKGKNPAQNIMLKPGDTIVVP